MDNLNSKCSKQPKLLSMNKLYKKLVQDISKIYELIWAKKKQKYLTKTFSTQSLVFLWFDFDVSFLNILVNVRYEWLAGSA